MIRRKQPLHDSADKAEIDLTPMLDVVFIMLIFFIVTASFIKEVGIAVDTPDSSPENISNTNEPILIQVAASNEIWMEGRRVDIRAVRANVARLHAENPEASLVIKADGKSSAKTYVAIADAARQANVYQISLLPDIKSL